MDEAILSRIRDCEQARRLLTSARTRLSGGVIRYCDDLLPDMYDNNFFEVQGDLCPEDLRLMYAFKQRRGEKHFKLVRETPCADMPGEECALLTMLKTDGAYPPAREKELVFKRLKREDISADLTALEVKHYAHIYGMDFTLRRCRRFYDLAREGGNGLDYFAAYLGETIAASCSVFVYGGAAGLDNLLTDRDCRHRGIATALLARVWDCFRLPVFLHADNDDTPKDMYRALGFETVNTVYEYLSIDK